MQIAPTTERWNEGECDWSFVKDPGEDIEAWEKCEGISLPENYRKFMLRYNGGRVYPRLFRTEAGLGRMLGPYVCEGDEAVCDLILSWSDVERIWKGEIYGEGVPPKHILFAETPGEIKLLMVLTPENYGQIYSWIHTNWDWGGEGNNLIFPIANGFSEFLSSLYDDDDKSDYKNWRIPIYDKLAKELRLEDLQ